METEAKDIWGNHVKDRHCLLLQECGLQDLTEVLEEVSKVHMRERGHCEHLPGPRGNETPLTVTEVIVFPIPLTPAGTYSAGKGQKRPCFSRASDRYIAVPSWGRGIVSEIKFGVLSSIGLRFLISES